ncbi:ArnT family glycosyltransferase [Candidatus Nitrososphaera evergladensis]|uniref:ArnT family glycosyltransferase n=1 Tax=Candidatus Nitrososphaera evergladensis TaxID=1459637 RepID=UPI00130D6BCA|nr:glycosyltransferase family 39 protein [Candidatus Nitrososphaera evergladensis]
MLSITISKKKYSLIIFIPIILSSFTHLWNATGFPDIFYDEGIYMRRAMNVLVYQMPQENPYYYDHPLFGQMFLAGLLAVTGFPDSLHPSASVQSVEELYLVPKIWMGLLAVLDTFLIYKIAEYKYNSRVAFLASLLFAVMPMSWLFRRILLESLLLPFLLSSILFALQLARSSQKQYLPALLSGVCLGLAIFTKIPVFAMIPLVGFMIYTGSSKDRKSRLRNIGIWLIPVILIPLLWPLQSISTNSFDNWVKGVLAQTQRHSYGVAGIFETFLTVDPVLLALGVVGLMYAIPRKDLFILLWLGPFLAFLWLIGYVQYFHILPVLPVFCIAGALWLNDLVDKIKSRKHNLAGYGIVASVVLFGLVSTTLLITTNVTSAQFEATAFALSIADKDTTIIANPVYAWPYKFVFHMPYAMNDYRDVLYSEINTDKVVLVSEPHLQGSIGEPQIRQAYDSTASVRTFYGNSRNYDVGLYPYTSMALNNQGDFIDVRQRVP